MDRLNTTYERLNATDSNYPSPNELWRRLEEVPPTPFKVCLSHGDLNVRNIFVRWNATDVILIDFSHVGLAPLSRDPCKLETSIAFSDTIPLLSDRIIRRLYRHPLLPPHDLPRENGQVEAIQQIRTQCLGEGVSNLEYEITCACHLLRFAQSPVTGNAPPATRIERSMWRRRVLAYELACRLSNNWERRAANDTGEM